MHGNSDYASKHTLATSTLTLSRLIVSGCDGRRHVSPVGPAATVVLLIMFRGGPFFQYGRACGPICEKFSLRMSFTYIA